MNNFKIETLNKWRRLNNKTVNNEPRPHIVPTSEDGHGYLKYMPFAPCMEGPTGPYSLGSGEAEVDGQWISVYRFKEIKNEENTLRRFEQSLARWVEAGRPEKGPIGDVSDEAREMQRFLKDD